MLYVYAVLEHPARTVRGVRLIRCGRVAVAVSERARAPAPTPRTLRAQDRVVRRLAEVTLALLPARFGTWARDEAELATLIRPLEGRLLRALRQVRNREQMTVRVLGTAFRPATRSRSGTGYLQRAAGAVGTPELRRLRDAVGNLVRAERVQHGRSPVLASVYHLVDRGAADAYVAALERAVRPTPALRLHVSGPHPAYAFAAEVWG